MTMPKDMKLLDEACFRLRDSDSFLLVTCDPEGVTNCCAVMSGPEDMAQIFGRLECEKIRLVTGVADEEEA